MVLEFKLIWHLDSSIFIEHLLHERHQRHMETSSYMILATTVSPPLLLSHSPFSWVCRCVCPYMWSPEEDVGILSKPYSLEKGLLSSRLASKLPWSTCLYLITLGLQHRQLTPSFICTHKAYTHCPNLADEEGFPKETSQVKTKGWVRVLAS